MASETVRETTKIVRPWGRFGSRYEVGASGYRYYCLAWIASFTALACIVLHMFGLVSIYTGLAFFLAGLAICCHFTWQATRHGRKIAG